MEARGCIALIRARMPQFRPSEAKIAKFVLANPEQALFMSALELTQQAGTSEATLVRFWRNLGYDSLFQFRLALARDWVRSTDEGNESGEELSYDSASGLIDSMTKQAMKSLQESRELLDPVELERAIEAVVNARKIDFYGMGASGEVAMYAAGLLQRIGLLCMSNSDYHKQLISAAMLRPMDVAIGISVSGSTREAIRALELARNAGATTIAITCYDKSPIMKVADIRILTAPYHILTTRLAWRSMLTQMNAVDILFLGIAHRIGDVAFQAAEKSVKSLVTDFEHRTK